MEPLLKPKNLRTFLASALEESPADNYFPTLNLDLLHVLQHPQLVGGN